MGELHFNQGRFDDARAAFLKARDDPASSRSAEQWLRYVDAEEQRRQYIAAAAGD